MLRYLSKMACTPSSAFRRDAAMVSCVSGAKATGCQSLVVPSKACTVDWLRSGLGDSICGVSEPFESRRALNVADEAGDRKCVRGITPCRLEPRFTTTACRATSCGRQLKNLKLMEVVEPP